MQTILRKIVLVVTLLVSVWTYAFVDYTPATVPDPKKGGQDCYVSDPDNILTDSDRVFINTCAQSLQKQTDVELAVVSLMSIGDMDCFDFCLELFQRWGIGKKGKNTGVLIVFVLNSHDIRIMTGTGIEGVLTDAICSDIIRREMAPAFRAGRYGEGLCCGVLRIYEVCTDGAAPEELQNMKSVTNRGKFAQMVSDDKDEEDEAVGTAGLIIWGMVLAFISIGFIAAWKEKRKCPKCGKRNKYVRSQIIKGATYAHDGNGIRYYKCEKCGHEWEERYTIPQLTRSSSSSSSSYDSDSSWSSSSRSSGGSWGGGSTSGGGAGGKW